MSLEREIYGEQLDVLDFRRFHVAFKDSAFSYIEHAAEIDGWTLELPLGVRTFPRMGKEEYEMKWLLKIIDSRRFPGSDTEMIHKTADGKEFSGPPIDTSKWATVIVEATDKPMDDGYYHIIKIIGPTISK